VENNGKQPIQRGKFAGPAPFSSNKAERWGPPKKQPQSKEKAGPNLRLLEGGKGKTAIKGGRGEQKFLRLVRTKGWGGTDFTQREIDFRGPKNVFFLGGKPTVTEKKKSHTS